MTRPAIPARTLPVLCCALMLALAPAAHAQLAPARSIKLVVPFGPGGPTDVSARIVAQVVQSGLGQTVVIENRPGAGGALGSKAVAAAEPDGSTLLIGTSATLGVVPALVKNPGYDPIKSFAPVAKVADSTLVLVAPAKFPANSVQEFVAYAKANPGKLSYASAGAGNQTQLLAELLSRKPASTSFTSPTRAAPKWSRPFSATRCRWRFPTCRFSSRSSAKDGSRRLRSPARAGIHNCRRCRP